MDILTQALNLALSLNNSTIVELSGSPCCAAFNLARTIASQFKYTQDIAEAIIDCDDPDTAWSIMVDSFDIEEYDYLR